MNIEGFFGEKVDSFNLEESKNHCLIVLILLDCTNGR